MKKCIRSSARKSEHGKKEIGWSEEKIAPR